MRGLAIPSLFIGGMELKNPNKYGGIVKLGGKRRKPFAARVTVGWELNKDTGKEKQKYKYIGYYETRPEAMIALAEYNKDPYNIDSRKISFKELYELFLKDKFPHGAITENEKNRLGVYNLGYNHSESLHGFPFSEIRKSHMQEVIDNSKLGYGSLRKVKSLYSQMYKLALENDWVEKDYAKFVTLPKKSTELKRKPFTNKEIKLLWDNLDKYEFIDAALIMIYTGLRPGELVDIENKDINIEERHLIGGKKTEAGTNRIIPIHNRILPLIKNRMSDKTNLITNKLGRKMSYSTFIKDRWGPLMKEINLTHTPHNCRHTFATLMDNAGANKVSIKKIMGHVSSDITDGVYTHKDLNELLKAVDLLN